MRLIDSDALLSERMRSKFYHLPNGDTAVPVIDIEHAPTVEDTNAPSKWIRVEDRLPKKPDGYPHSEIRRSYFLVALESGCVKSLGFDFDRMEWHYTGSPVTHWMQLPEPPKEESND